MLQVDVARRGTRRGETSSMSLLCRLHSLIAVAGLAQQLRPPFRPLSISFAIASNSFLCLDVLPVLPSFSLSPSRYLRLFLKSRIHCSHISIFDPAHIVPESLPTGNPAGGLGILGCCLDRRVTLEKSRNPLSHVHCSGKINPGTKGSADVAFASRDEVVGALPPVTAVEVANKDWLGKVVPSTVACCDCL